MQRLFNLSKWELMHGGSALRFDNPKRRMVTLEVNASALVALFVAQDSDLVADNTERHDDQEAGRRVMRIELPGENPVGMPEDDGKVTRFLALVEGRDTLSFGVDGPFTLFSGDHEVIVHVYSIDGQDTFVRVEAPEIFTRIANPKARNPQLELVEYQMRVNVERRVNALAEEAGRRIVALEQQVERYATDRPKRTAAARGRQAFADAGPPPEPRGREEPKDGEESAVGGGSAEPKASAAGTSKSRAKAKPSSGS